MRAADILLYLQRNRITVFTTGDLAKIIGKPKRYASKIASRIPGVKKAEKGVYYTEQASIYEVASNIVPFSYVSMLSALRYYDLTTQMPFEIAVISPRRHRPVKLGDYRIAFVRLKPNLIFGHVRRGNAFIAEPEKAILDSLYLGEYAYLDEALQRGIAEKSVSAGKLVEYAERFGKRSLLNKLGFFLEHYANVSKPGLLKKISRKPVYIAAGAKDYDKKWRVFYG